MSYQSSRSSLYDQIDGGMMTEEEEKAKQKTWSKILNLVMGEEESKGRRTGRQILKEPEQCPTSLVGVVCMTR